MDKYEQISVVGEGSYGLVMKCRHKETDQVVAIKKFLETEEDATIRRMALREIRMLKRLKHENLVAMIEVFRHRKRFYLVFEFLDGTVLDELERIPGGLGDERSRERIFQVIRAINYCHSNHIIHRDVKPENVLVSSLGVVKLCDFGFARLISMSGEPCTEYVATRWYRAPELLVGENNYGPSVDVWAIGCLFAEMMTGDPLFPGDSDIDQLYLIVKMLGKPCVRHQQLMSKSSQLRGMIKSASSDPDLYKHFPSWSMYSLDFLASCMRMNPAERSTSEELLKSEYFIHDKFPQRFLPALREKVNMEFNGNPLLRKHKTEILMSTDKRDEGKGRKLVYNEQVRWKLNLTEGSVKRKFSYEMFNANDHANENKNLVSLSKVSQRLNVAPKPSPTVLVKQISMQKPTGGAGKRETDIASSVEMQMLEKSLESLVKFNHKQENPPRPASVEKHETGSSSSPLTVLSPSPLPFQSLEPNYGDFNKSSNILHPTINNISFTRDPPKKSPSLLQGIGSFSTKSNVNQAPLLSNPRNQFLKKLERNIVVENMFGNNNNDSASTNQTNWLNTFGASVHSNKKKQEAKPRTEVLTLPNLPGATGSPNKDKKKKNFNDSDATILSTTVTPRIQSSTSQKF